MSHSADDCTGVLTKRPINDGMGGTIGSRNYAVQQYKNSEKMEEGSESSQESKQNCYIAFPRNPACAVRSSRSRRPRNKLLKGIASLPVMILTLICCYPSIAAEINIEFLLDVRR